MRKLLLQFVFPILAAAGLAVFLVYSSKPENAWTRPLRAAAADADRIVVEGGGQHPAYEIRGADNVRELFALIDIDPERSDSHCLCDGEFVIRVFKGDKEVVTLSYHHGHSLRWQGGAWKWDGYLTETSQEALPRWFQQNGCAYLQQHRQQRRDEADARSRKLAQEMEQRRADEEEFSADLADEGSRGAARTVVVCRALGRSDCHWTVTGPDERELLDELTGDAKHFLKALEKMRGDPTGLRGAARLFFSEGYYKKVPAEARLEWVVRLATVVFTEGRYDDKSTCLRILAKERDPAIQALLRDVFRGKVGKEMDLAKAYGQEPGLRAGAALTLVMMGDETFKPEIERMLPQAKAKADIAALEVCLALLGDPTYIKTEHFFLESYSIGLGGLKAIERYKGAHGMEALVKGGINHPWGRVNEEALNTFERITGRKMSHGEIEDWWEVEHEGKRDRPEPILQFGGNTSPLGCVAFSPDGSVIATGSDSAVKIWNAQTGEMKCTLRGHESPVTHIAFHPSGKHLATPCGNATIKIWDLSTGKDIRTLTGHQDWVDHVAYSPDGTHLASAAGEDGLVRIWNPASGETVSTFGEPRDAIVSLAYRPDGKRIAVAHRGRSVQIWDVNSGKVQRTLRGHAEFGWRVAYSPDGHYLAVTGSDDNSVSLWDADSGELLRLLEGHTNSVSGVAFSPDGKRIASTGWDKTIKVWDATSGKELVSFKGHPEMIKAIAYSPDGKRLATADGKTIRIWDLEKLLPLKP